MNVKIQATEDNKVEYVFEMTDQEASLLKVYAARTGCSAQEYLQTLAERGV